MIIINNTGDCGFESLEELDSVSISYNNSHVIISNRTESHSSDVSSSDLDIVITNSTTSNDTMIIPTALKVLLLYIIYLIYLF